MMSFEEDISGCHSKMRNQRMSFEDEISHSKMTSSSFGVEVRGVKGADIKEEDEEDQEEEDDDDEEEENDEEE